MTTVREIADKLGVSKTAVMKFCKEELHLKTEPRRALQLSANDCAAIADRFSADTLGEYAETENQGLQSGLQLSAHKVVSLQSGLQLSAHEVVSLQIENAGLRARVGGLERENELLRERLDVADAALEREQQQRRGFWNRLGQRLLGSGGGE